MRYLLFAGDAYYPQGGWWDFVGAFGSVEKAKEAKGGVRRAYDWAHIVDSQDQSIIWAYTLGGWVPVQDMT